MRSRIHNELIGFLAMLLALGGLAPHLFFEVSHLLRKSLPPRIDMRYLALREALPSDERLVGYLSDENIRFPVGARLYTHAQYALSPHLLVAEGCAKYVVVNVSNPLEMAAFFRERGLRPICISSEGAALAIRSK